MNLRIKTPDQLGKQTKEKMASWKARKKREALQGKKLDPEPVVKPKIAMSPLEHEALNGELKEAVKNGQKKKAEELIAQGADINMSNKYGWGLLLTAVWNNHEEIVELLISHGMDVNAKNSEGWTGLMLAATNENTSMVELLIRNGADVHLRNNEGKTAMHYAMQKNNLAIANRLSGAERK